ncbi:MAG: hypothetical protein F4Z19_07025 [Holophagales bacterium]|nr:hypothetical protein [Holophagales bacterium]
MSEKPKRYGEVNDAGFTELRGRHWFVNLRSSGERAFGSRPFPDSVLILQSTSLYITVETDDGVLAVIPWSAISFLSNSSGLE